jgi:DDE superfamily endonuclease
MNDEEMDYATVAAMYSWYESLCAVVGGMMEELTITTRDPSITKQKMIWAEYVLSFSTHPKFIRRHLRMTLPSFNKLLGYIRQQLEVDQKKAECRGGAIMPEICLFCTLRFLAGGSYLDIHALTGVSVPSFYRVVYRTLRLIIECKQLDLQLPRTAEECVKIADGFRLKSYKQAITNCIGAIDGYLLRIITPPKDQAGNVRSYYSGHYSCYGINIQAVCDHQSRFLFFAIAAPGSVNDREAVKETGLLEKLKQLPKLYVLIGDAAYEPTERLVPIFYGVNRQNEECDNFNFYASQCRIRIEMAFGLMQMKWGVLWRPLRIKLDNIKYIVLAIARLHNFTINERLLNDEQMEEVSTGAHRVYNLTEVDEEINANEKAKEKHLKGISIIRDRMVERIV